MEINERIRRHYVLASNKVQKIPIADFHHVNESKLPAMQSLLDGLSRQEKAHEEHGLYETETEDFLQANISSSAISGALLRSFICKISYKHLIPHKSYTWNSDGPSLPTSFKNAFKDSDQAVVIYNE